MKYPYKVQKQIAPLMEIVLSIMMLVTYLIDLLQILFYNVTIRLDDYSTIIYGTTFTILLNQQIKQSRFTTYPLLFAHATLLLSKYYSHQSYIALILGLILQILYFACIMIMPQYQYPKCTGKYMVGFREFALAGKLVSVYYPTETKSKINFIYANRGVDYVKQVYSDFQHVIPWRPPLIFIRIMLQFMNKIKVEDLQVGSPIIPGKLPSVLFANGLGGLKDHYACFHKEFASNGYIVYAIQQDEEAIILNSQEMMDFRTGKATLENQLGQEMLKKVKRIRHDQLNDRVSSFLNLLNFVYAEQNIDQNKIIVAGHSFGAGTVYRASQLEPTKIRGVILFDPWFLPLKESDLDIEINKPILCINSETFRHRKENETMERYTRVFSQQKHELVVMIKGSQHLCCTDLLFKMPFEMLMLRRVENIKGIQEITVAHQRLSLYFLNTLSCKKTIQMFEEFSNKNYEKSIHEVEYLK